MFLFYRCFIFENVQKLYSTILSNILLTWGVLFLIQGVILKYLKCLGKDQDRHRYDTYIGTCRPLLGRHVTQTEVLESLE
jgi:hypothetical protein